MKHSLVFWSRKLHCWVGVYLSAITLVWLGEMAILPALYDPGLEKVAESAAGTDAPAGSEILPVQEVLERFGRERAGGETLIPDSVTLLVQEGVWLVRDTRRHVSIRYDAYTGAVQERSFDSAKLIEERYGLAWLSPALGSVVRLSFQPLFILLCVTGLHLYLGRRLFQGRKRSSGRETEGGTTLESLRAGESCLYEKTDDPYLAGRLAALGFLPGVGVDVLRNRGRGPVLVLVRHTRVALSREIASMLIVARKG